MTETSRARGITAYPMPKDVCGPRDRYALVLRTTKTGIEARMVHTEGVAYLVTTDKPWKWNDYDPNAETFSLNELLGRIDSDKALDLADWVREFGARLESNFWQVYAWATDKGETR